MDACANRTLLNLKLSPLKPWSNFTGDYYYYSGTESIREAISDVATSFERPLKLLVVIDGPPGATCRWARYPAVPIVLDASNGMDVSIDFFLDDSIRSEEKETAIAWEQQCQVLGLDYQRMDYHFEKGGMLLRVNSLAETDTSLIRSEELASEKKEQEAILSAISQADELLVEFEALKKGAAVEKEEAQQAFEQLKQQLEAKTGDLQTVTTERDARAKEKGEAQQAVEQLKQQLEAKGGELQKVVGERDARAKEKGEAQQAVEQLKQQLVEKVSGVVWLKLFN